MPQFARASYRGHPPIGRHTDEQACGRQKIRSQPPAGRALRCARDERRMGSGAGDLLAPDGGCLLRADRDPAACPGRIRRVAAPRTPPEYSRVSLVRVSSTGGPQHATCPALLSGVRSRRPNQRCGQRGRWSKWSERRWERRRPLAGSFVRGRIMAWRSAFQSVERGCGRSCSSPQRIIVTRLSAGCGRCSRGCLVDTRHTGGRTFGTR